MPSLHSTLRHLTDEFVGAILGALRASSVQDLLGTASDEEAAPSVAPRHTRVPASTPAPKRPRVVQSNAELAPYTQRIVALVAKSPRGLRAGELRAAVHLEGRAFERALQGALAAGDVARQGTRASARYLPANGPALRPSSRPTRGRPRVNRAPSASVERDAREAYDTHDATQIHDPEALLRRRQDAPTQPLPPPLEGDTALVVETPVTLARLSTPTLREGEEILRTPTGSAVLRRKSASAV